MSVLRSYRSSCSSNVLCTSSVQRDLQRSFVYHDIHLIQRENYKILFCSERDPPHQRHLLPHQIIFSYAGQLYTFFDGSLQGYRACVYMRSHDQFNLIYSSCKSALSAPQSVLATRMQQKISQELSNLFLSPPVFLGDWEIILRMIANGDPAAPPVFYGTRIMEIAATSKPNNWF